MTCNSYSRSGYDKTTYGFRSLKTIYEIEEDEIIFTETNSCHYGLKIEESKRFFDKASNQAQKLKKLQTTNIKLQASIKDLIKEAYPLMTGRFYDVLHAPNWTDKFSETTTVELILKYCMRQYQNKVFTVKDLPHVNAITMGRIEKIHVIWCSDPSNLHVILSSDSSEYELNLYNEKWLNVLFEIQKRRNIHNNLFDHDIMSIVMSKYCFNKPLELFCGLSCILTKYIKFLQYVKMKSLKLNPTKLIQFYIGDLVIASVKRGNDVNLGYRAVIVDLVMIMTKSQFNNECFIIYLLDTGEKHVISKDLIHPLPEAFVGFTPMAVKCSLLGISPIGPIWNTMTKERIQNIIEFASTERKILIAEFYSQSQTDMHENKKKSETDMVIKNLIVSQPYLIDLFKHPSASKFIIKLPTISKLLVDEKLAKKKRRAERHSLIPISLSTFSRRTRTSTSSCLKSREVFLHFISSIDVYK